MRRNEKTDERTNAGREERSKQKQATKHASTKNEKQSRTFWVSIIHEGGGKGDGGKRGRVGRVREREGSDIPY